MSFKVSNIAEDKLNSLIKTQVETVTASKTLNPSIPITKVIATSSFAVDLPNGTLGFQKIITTVGGNGNIQITFNSGYGDGTISVTLYDEGDMLILWASVNGWHYESRRTIP